LPTFLQFNIFAKIAFIAAGMQLLLAALLFARNAVTHLGGDLQHLING
jgi:hypothetical protein